MPPQIPAVPQALQVPAMRLGLAGEEAVAEAQPGGKLPQGEQTRQQAHLPQPDRPLSPAVVPQILQPPGRKERYPSCTSSSFQMDLKYPAKAG